MQTESLTAMPDTCTVLRNTPVSGSGGSHASWAPVATTKCRLSPIGSPSESPLNAEIAAQFIWKLVTPYGTDIRPRDRVQFGTRIFEVIGGGTKSWEIAQGFIVVEILH